MRGVRRRANDDVRRLNDSTSHTCATQRPDHASAGGLNTRDAVRPTPPSRVQRSPREYDVETVESGAQQLSPADRARRPQRHMRARPVVQIDNATPMLPSRGWFSTHGIRGTVSQSSSSGQLERVSTRAIAACASTSTIVVHLRFRNGCLTRRRATGSRCRRLLRLPTRSCANSAS